MFPLQKLNLFVIFASLGLCIITYIISRFRLFLKPLEAALMVVIAEIATKKLLKKYEYKTVAFYSMAAGGIFVLPLAALELWNNPLWIYQVTKVGFWGILFGILFASYLAYIAWHKGLTLMPAGEASFFFYLDPVTGAALSIILLGEKLTSSLILGGILIIIGVILAEHKRKIHPLHRHILD